MEESDASFADSAIELSSTKVTIEKELGNPKTSPADGRCVFLQKWDTEVMEKLFKLMLKDKDGFVFCPCASCRQYYLRTFFREYPQDTPAYYMVQKQLLTKLDLSILCTCKAIRDQALPLLVSINQITFPHMVLWRRSLKLDEPGTLFDHPAYRIRFHVSAWEFDDQPAWGNDEMRRLREIIARTKCNSAELEMRLENVNEETCGMIKTLKGIRDSLQNLRIGGIFSLSFRIKFIAMLPIGIQVDVVKY